MTFPQFVYRNVFRNKRTYSAYFFSSAFSVFIFFIYAMFIFHPDLKKEVTAALAVQMMITAEVIVYLFSFLFVLYSVSTFLKSRKREFGVLMMHGMTGSQLNSMVFLENMLIGITAIAVGMGVGMITGKLFLMIGSRVIGIDPLPFYLSPTAWMLTIGAFFILFFSISIFTTILVKTNKLIDLLKAGEKPKKEPKTSIFLSLVSAILLLISYYLAATANLGTIMFRMIPVIAMTVVGTYFFYTQLSVFIMKRLQKHRPLFWRKTNLITISSLSYRLKDNAQMFFMVTIVLTVAFCAVGSLASMNVMNKEFKKEYPAAISYLAEGNKPVHQKNLLQIKTDLKKKKISYTTNQIFIKYVSLASSTDKYVGTEIPVVSFSDYKKIAAAAGYKIAEKPLEGEKVLDMRTSSFSNEEEIVYVLKQNHLKLNVEQATKNVVLPMELIFDQGMVISDELFQELIPVKTMTFTGFYAKEMEKTAGMLGGLVNNGKIFFVDNQPYSIIVSGTLYENQINMYKMMLFIALLIGAVFFLAAGSFLYFRLYADLDYDKRQYLIIKKIGLTDGELHKIVTHQLLLLFFVPIVVAIVHSTFAFMALQSFYTLSIAKEMMIVLAGFLVAQVVYFFVIRYRYLQNLRRSLI